MIRTYGDLAKTKTISRKKHHRILHTLIGQELNNPDSSKFRFWVKAKGNDSQVPATCSHRFIIVVYFYTGFSTETPPNFKEVPDFHTDTSRTDSIDSPPPTAHLYVPNITKEPDVQPFRRVAIVEEFFDIIYNVHVGLGGRSGRHAGQKRTYRTITETYAFLPRDAVTRFLAGCSTCNNNNRAADSPRPFTPSSGSAIGSVTTATDRRLTDDAFTDSSSGAENGLDAQPPDADGMSADLSKLSVGQDLMNYYQLLRRMYEQTLAAQNASATGADSTIDLTMSDAFSGQNNDRSSLCCSPAIADNQHSNIVSTKPNEEVTISCQPTSLKIRDRHDNETGTNATNETMIGKEEIPNGNSGYSAFNAMPSESNVNNNNNNDIDDLWPKCERSDWEPLADVKKNEFGKCVELRSVKVVSDFTNLIAQYFGAAPFSDAKTLCRLLRQL